MAVVDVRIEDGQVCRMGTGGEQRGAQRRCGHGPQSLQPMLLRCLPN
jgi:hypothetical protein